MARPPKAIQQEVPQEDNTKYVTLEELEDRLSTFDVAIQDLLSRVEALEAKANRPKAQSINKVETFNNEVEPVPYEDSYLRLNASDRLQSARNAIRLLPPNMIVDGRHSKENIGAICGFIVSDEMWDEIYEDFVHEAYN